MSRFSGRPTGDSELFFCKIDVFRYLVWYLLASSISEGVLGGAICVMIRWRVFRVVNGANLGCMKGRLALNEVSKSSPPRGATEAEGLTLRGRPSTELESKR